MQRPLTRNTGAPSALAGPCTTDGDKKCYSKRAVSFTDCAAQFASLAAGDVGATSGNSRECRAHYLGLAAAGRTTTRTRNCPHAGLSGGDLCTCLLVART